MSTGRMSTGRMSTGRMSTGTFAQRPGWPTNVGLTPSGSF